MDVLKRRNTTPSLADFRCGSVRFHRHAGLQAAGGPVAAAGEHAGPYSGAAATERLCSHALGPVVRFFENPLWLERLQAAQHLRWCMECSPRSESNLLEINQCRFQSLNAAADGRSFSGPRIASNTTTNATFLVQVRPLRHRV